MKFLAKSVVIIISFMGINLSAMDIYEALEYTFANNPQIESARATLAAQAQNVAIANSSLLPQIGAGVSSETTFNRIESEQNITNNSERWTSSANVGLNQVIYNRALILGSDIAKERLTLDELLYLQTEQQVLFGAASAYINYIKQEKILTLRKTYENVLKEQVDIIDASFEVGELTKTDKYQAQARYNGATSAKIAAQANLISAEASFIQYIGKQPKNLQQILLPKSFPKSQGQAIDIAYNNSINLQVARAQVEIANKSWQQAKSARYPVVSGKLQGSWSENHHESPDRNIENNLIGNASINLSVPIYQGGAITAKIDAAKDSVIAAEKSLIANENLLKDQVISAWGQYEASSAQSESFKSQIFAAVESAKGIKKEFELGNRPLVDLLNAELEVVNANENYINSMATEAIAAWALLQVIGIINIL